LKGKTHDLHYDVEYRMRTVDTAAVGARLALVPAPRGMIVSMLTVGAGDVRLALAPLDPQRVEHVALAPLDGGANILGRYELLGHHWRFRMQCSDSDGS